eukprot:Amastigsp_a509617_36.p5 type:complete len:113 gc:universal Amastigsp_a509617_36:1600-1938(+)
MRVRVPEAVCSSRAPRQGHRAQRKPRRACRKRTGRSERDLLPAATKTPSCGSAAAGADRRLAFGARKVPPLAHRTKLATDNSSARQTLGAKIRDRRRCPLVLACSEASSKQA